MAYKKIKYLLYLLLFFVGIIQAQVILSPRWFGPTQFCDNPKLWVKKIQLSKQASENQWLVALVKANPEAFVQNNLHGLKVGYLLQMPDMTVMMKMTPDEATAMLAQFDRDWSAKTADSLLSSEYILLADRGSECSKITANDTARFFYHPYLNLNEMQTFVKQMQPVLRVLSLRLDQANTDRQNLSVQLQQLTTAQQKLQQDYLQATQKNSEWQSQWTNAQALIVNLQNSLKTLQESIPESFTVSALLRFSQMDLQKKIQAQPSFFNLDMMDQAIEFLWLLIMIILCLIIPLVDMGIQLLKNDSATANHYTPMASVLNEQLSKDVKETKDIKSKGGINYSYFAGADIISSKLDLARAYLDMEDFHGAADIINNVIAEGTEAQKQEAYELQKRIPQ